MGIREARLVVEITHSHFVALLFWNVIDLYEGSMRYRASPLRMAQTSQTRASVKLGERTV